MNRIDGIFAALRGRGEKALMPFVTVGDPSLQTTAELLPVIEQAGASVCELGIPFSDPIADGAVIQASMAHALNQGVKVHQIMEMVARLRPQLKMGLVAMVSYSIVHRVGKAAFIKQAAEAGMDGFIFPDLPVEEAADVLAKVKSAGLICSMLIAPTTPLARAKQIAQACSGFVYLLARAGITGERSELPTDLPLRIAAIREVTTLPIAVGFGISDAGQARAVAEHADAVIVGSAVMRRVAQYRQAKDGELKSQVSSFVAELSAGVKQVQTK